MKISPDSPVRADQRLIRLLLRSKDDQYSSGMGERLSQLFVDRGGSWTALFLGSTEDMSLLKKLLKEVVDASQK